MRSFAEVSYNILEVSYA